MSTTSLPVWNTMRTDETRRIEAVLRAAGFAQTDAYRYNSAVIRVRVIDPRFEGVPDEKRDGLLDTHLEQLPERTQADIMTLLTFAPSELRPGPKAFRAWALNQEFEDPSPSVL